MSTRGPEPRPPRAGASLSPDISQLPETCPKCGAGFRDRVKYLPQHVWLKNLHRVPTHERLKYTCRTCHWSMLIKTADAYDVKQLDADAEWYKGCLWGCFIVTSMIIGTKLYQLLSFWMTH